LSGVSASVLGPHEVRLSLSPIGEAAGYQIERSDDGGINFFPVDIITAASYNDTDSVPDGTAIEYRVEALNDSGASDPSTVAFANTPLGKPANLTADAVSDSQVQLSWDSQSNLDVTYLIERSDDGQTYTQIDSTDSDNYLDGALKPYTQYYYRIRGQANGAQTDYCDPADATTDPATPTIALTGNPSATLGVAYHLAMSAVFPQDNPDSDTVSTYGVDWGDSQSDSHDGPSANADHTYNDPGTYTITVTATCPAGDFVASMQVTVAGSTSGSISFPGYNPSSPPSITEGTNHSFSASFSGSATLKGWVVDFGDGSGDQQFDSSTDTFNHTYAHGDYGSGHQFNISVSAVTDSGIIRASRNVLVTTTAPTPDPTKHIQIPSTGQSGDGIDWFYWPCNSYPHIGHDYEVDWGDGTVNSYPIPDNTGPTNGPEDEAAEHDYAEEGAYYVTVSDDLGESGSAFANGGDDETTQLSMDNINPQVVNLSDTLHVSTNYSGFGAHDIVATFVDWGDGKGNQSLGFGGGSINASRPMADLSPGVHTGTLSATEIESGDTVSKTFTYHVNGNVLLIDSNNDDGLIVPVPQNTPLDEQKIANDTTKPGKIIQVDNNDVDGDHIPDFADGFGKYGQTLPDTPASRFVPISIALPEWMSPDTTQIKFTYSSSDPNAVTRDGFGTATSPYVYTPDAGGKLRLWTLNGPDTRNPAPVSNDGNWIKSGETFDGTKLGAWPNNLTWVYIEAVSPSAAMADLQISVQLTATAGQFSGKTASSSVRVTAVSFQSGVDGNRNQIVDLDGRDSTSASSPYRFWLNDNKDLVTSVDDFSGLGNFADPTSKQKVQDSEPADPGKEDSRDNLINGTRDLQDFAPYVLAISAPGGSNIYDHISFQLTGVGGETAPKIRLWSGIGTTAAYLTNSALASEVVHDDNAHNWQTIVVSDQPTIIPKDSVNPHVTLDGRFNHGGDSNSETYYIIFEGISAGTGKLSVQFIRKGSVIGSTSSYLSLKSVEDMFEHYSADPGDNPNAQHTYGNFQYTDSSPESSDYVIYVHGWDMNKADREDYSETAYKRLFWQGYKGRFGFFSWPTTISPEGGHWVTVGRAVSSDTFRKTYDSGEQAALNSGSTLLAVLQSLYAQYPGHVNLLAHSMGNIVASEALRQEAILPNPVKIVKTYVASHASEAAGSYDGRYAKTLPANGTPDMYEDYGGPGIGYFSGIHKGLNTFVNFFNPVDWALSANIWQRDQGAKPDVGFGYGPFLQQNAQNIVVPPAGTSSRYLFYRFLNQFPNDNRIAYLNPDNLSDLYTIMSFADPAETLALGAAANVGGPVDSEFNMHLQLGFGGHHWQHDAEFMSDFAEVGAFWASLLSAFGL
jgi:hypothetical protein